MHARAFFERYLRGGWIYVLTVAGAAVAFGATQYLPRVFGRLPFAPYMIIGGLLTLFCGRAAGLLMTALTFVATLWLQTPPVRPLEGLGAALLALPTVWFIDRHQQAVRALRESRYRYQRLCELSNDIILTNDRDGRIVSVNAAGPRLAGYPPDAIVGRHSLEFVAPEHRERAIAARKQLLDGDASTVAALEVDVRAADGSTVTVDVRSGLVMADGKVAGFHTVARDMTERRRMEGQLRQSQKMEAVGRLAGGVAHDFNNMLTAIMGFAEVSLNGLGPDHPEAGHLRQILKTSDRAAELVRQLLAFGRRQVLRPIVVDPNEVLASLDSMLRRLIGADVALETRFGTDVGRVRVDPNQLIQILMNLAVNARDAMPQGGRLTMATGSTTAEPGAQRDGTRIQPGAYVVLTVADTGCGMDRATQARIFEPFFTTKPEGQGTGLGLATVYGIVKQSGGYIWVESQVGCGTRFEVYFQRVDDVAEEISVGAEVTSVCGTETVLVAEDEPAVRQLAREALGAVGYRVLDAADGVEALALATHHEAAIDMVVTDLVMPGMSGQELVTHLRRLRPGVRVLLISGYAPPASITAPFLQKPFTPRSLAREVRRILDAPSP
jgi:PAS domain S-box-containing protein